MADVTETWPPRWKGANFKHDQPNRKVVERQDKLKLVAKERQNKEKVRKRDKGCRFPLCGCKKFRRHTEVSHSEHKGMGGNPAGDRSTPELMILICPFRHKENRVSIDKGTLRWRPLTDKGSNGPVVWETNLPAIQSALGTGVDGWVELAREKAAGEVERLTHSRSRVLKALAEMSE